LLLSWLAALLNSSIAKSRLLSSRPDSASPTRRMSLRLRLRGAVTSAAQLPRERAATYLGVGENAA
jgi:hypothetical protein